MMITSKEFDTWMHDIFPSVDDIPSRLGIAVSGGGDSMALLRLIAQWAVVHAPKIHIHVLTVDHGLRAESKAEAKQVAAWVKKFRFKHKILMWVGDKPKTKIAEAARAKRYQLMADYCHAHQIMHLFLAHHADDQAETVLMRLAAGSGVDGLAGMERVSLYQQVPSRRRPGSREFLDSGLRRDDTLPCGDDTVYLCRPLLSVSHDRLLETLRAAGQKWIEDPSNTNQKSARVRVRTARDVLAAEGLTADRMGKLAIRVSRARDVLNAVADRAWDDEVQVDTVTRTVTMLRDDYDGWFTDTQIRVITRVIETVSGRAARMEQVEDVVDAFAIPGDKTIRRTLAGCIMTRGAKWVKIVREIKNKID